jgi:hypothetical protein
MPRRDVRGSRGRSGEVIPGLDLDVPRPSWLEGLSESSEFPVREALADSLYYPCSWTDGTPVRLAGRHFRSFIYSDYSLTRRRILDEFADGGFRGYAVAFTRELRPDQLFPAARRSAADAHEDAPVAPQLGVDATPSVGGWPGSYFSMRGHRVDRDEPFALWSVLDRENAYDDEHGSPRYSILFTNAEGADLCRDLYCAHSVPPLALAHLRSGMGFGGNYHGYPSRLSRAIESNRAGLPQYILHDWLCQRGGGDYLPLMERYRLVGKRSYREESGGFSRVFLGVLETPGYRPWVDHNSEDRLPGRRRRELARKRLESEGRREHGVATEPDDDQMKLFE